MVSEMTKFATGLVIGVLAILMSSSAPPEKVVLTGHTDPVYSVAWSPDGATLASGSTDETVILWDAKTGERLRRLEGHSAAVWSVGFSPDGEGLASGSEDGTVILWNAKTGERLRTWEGRSG